MLYHKVYTHKFESSKYFDDTLTGLFNRFLPNTCGVPVANSSSV